MNVMNAGMLVDISVDPPQETRVKERRRRTDRGSSQGQQSSSPQEVDIEDIKMLKNYKKNPNSSTEDGLKIGLIPFLY